MHRLPPTRATLGDPTFLTFPYQTWGTRLFYENRKLGSARRVVRSAAGHYCCDGRFTLLARRTVYHLNSLASLAGSTRSR